MRYAFICGPYRSTTEWGVESHVRRAIQAAAWAKDDGACPIIPHTMYRGAEGPFAVKEILEHCLHWLEVCDEIVVLPTWRMSNGAMGEVRRAIEMSLPITWLVRDPHTTWGLRPAKLLTCMEAADFERSALHWIASHYRAE